MARYKIWDKQENIFTLVPNKNGKQEFTPDEWIATKCQWAKNPNAKVVIAGGIANGAYLGELSQMKENYSRDITFTDEMTDEEILAAIEEFETNPPKSTAPSENDKLAAAINAQTLVNMEG